MLTLLSYCGVLWRPWVAGSTLPKKYIISGTLAGWKFWKGCKENSFYSLPDQHVLAQKSFLQAQKTFPQAEWKNYY